MQHRFALFVASLFAITACSDSVVSARNDVPPTSAAEITTPSAPAFAAAPAPSSEDKIIFQDGFNSYSDLNGLRSKYARAGAISLVAGRGGSGKAVRFSYSGSNTYNLLERSIPESKDLFVSYWFRTSVGADPTNGGSNRWGMSILRAERAASSRWALSVTQSPAVVGVNDNSAAGMPNPVMPNVNGTPTFGSTTDGAWHNFTARLVSGSTGYAQIWLDGTLLTDTRPLAFKSAANGVVLLRFPGELFATPSKAFVVDIDDIAVWQPSGAAPSPTPVPVPVARVAISPASVSLKLGAQQQLIATTYDSAGNTLTGRSVTWTASNASIASVSTSGLAKGVSAGTTTILATSEGRTASANVSVTATTVPVASVSVALGASSLTAGKQTTATATLRDSAGNVLTGRSVNWSSSNTAVATVSSAGAVTAVTAGTADIIATSEGRTGRATLTVSTAQPVPVAAVNVSPSSGTLQVGQTLQFSATTRDASGAVLTGRAISWSSSNLSIVRVSASGIATAVAAGSATITATSEGRSGSASVSVTAAPPPSSGGAPEPTSSSRILFQDNFDSGSLSGYAKRGIQQVVAGRTGNGVAFPYSTSATDNLIEKSFAASTDVYIRYWYKTSPGADPTCGDRGGSGMKWFMAWREGAARYTMGVGNLGQQTGLEFTTHDNSSSKMPNPFVQNVSKTPKFGTTNDGKWHKYTVHIVTGSGGYEQIWVDDVRVLDNSGSAYDHSSIGISLIQFPGAVVSMYSNCDFTITVDDLAVWSR